MKNKGFTLIEVLIGLCLLGLISIIILPIISFSFNSSNRNSGKMEMIYLGEMVIENLKAYKYENNTNHYILNTKVEDIMDIFKLNKTADVTLTSEGEYAEYRITIEKKERNSKLWEILVSIDFVEEGDKRGVKYKAILPL